jgi:hypothetical protein
VCIAAVFEDGEFGKFECDNSLEEFGEESFVIKIFLVFSSGGIKKLSASVTLYTTVALTSSIN